MSDGPIRIEAGAAVLAALHRLQAEIATAAMGGPGLAVVLPAAAFDALVDEGLLKTYPLGGPIGVGREFLLNTPSGCMTVRRAEPYQPLRFAMPDGSSMTFIADPSLRPGEVRMVPHDDRQHLSDQLNAAARRVGTGPETSSKSDEAASIPPKPAVKRLNSPNFNDRKAEIDVILLHHTGSNSTHGALLHLCDPKPPAALNGTGSPVSAHYVVSPEGLVWQLVDDDRRAWHAGECELRGERCDMNGRSIGIELVNAGDGRMHFTDAQYAIVRQLVAHLQARYHVPWENVLGHRDVAVPKGRKTDPADNFEWYKVLPHEESLKRGLLQPSP